MQNTAGGRLVDIVTSLMFNSPPIPLENGTVLKPFPLSHFKRQLSSGGIAHHTTLSTLNSLGSSLKQTDPSQQGR